MRPSPYLTAPLLLLLRIAASVDGYASLASTTSRSTRQHYRSTTQLHSSQTSSAQQDGAIQSSSNNKKKDELLDLLSSVPSNAPTPRKLTDDILAAVRQLEQQCPTSDDHVLTELAGNWELVWTAQDKNSAESKRGAFSWINPLENQSYSNNPNGGGGAGGGGRANPILPRDIQDGLERMGILEPSGQQETSSIDSSPVRSSQAIDMKRSRVRNVVSVEVRKPLPVRGSLVVDVGFKPNMNDKRKIDVKFDSVRLQLKNSPVDITFPLGIIGPTGWLRTGYIDEDMRITRGHKGSVFILSRTAAKKGIYDGD